MEALGAIAAAVQLVDVAARALVHTIELVRKLHDAPRRTRTLLNEVEKSTLWVLRTSQRLLQPGARFSNDLSDDQLASLSTCIEETRRAMDDARSFLARLCDGTTSEPLSTCVGQAQPKTVLRRALGAMAMVGNQEEIGHMLGQVGRLNLELLGELEVVGLEMQADLKDKADSLMVVAYEHHNELCTRLNEIDDAHCEIKRIMDANHIELGGQTHQIQAKLTYVAQDVTTANAGIDSVQAVIYDVSNQLPQLHTEESAQMISQDLRAEIAALGNQLHEVTSFLASNALLGLETPPEKLPTQYEARAESEIAVSDPVKFSILELALGWEEGLCLLVQLDLCPIYALYTVSLGVHNDLGTLRILLATDSPIYTAMGNLCSAGHGPYFGYDQNEHMWLFRAVLHTASTNDRQDLRTRTLEALARDLQRRRRDLNDLAEEVLSLEEGLDFRLSPGQTLDIGAFDVFNAMVSSNTGIPPRLDCCRMGSVYGSIMGSDRVHLLDTFYELGFWDVSTPNYLGRTPIQRHVSSFFRYSLRRRYAEEFKVILFWLLRRGASPRLDPYSNSRRWPTVLFYFAAFIPYMSLVSNYWTRFGFRELHLETDQCQEDSEYLVQLDMIMTEYTTANSRFHGSEDDFWALWWQVLDIILPPLTADESYGFDEKGRGVDERRGQRCSEQLRLNGYDPESPFVDIIEMHFGKHRHVFRHSQWPDSGDDADDECCGKGPKPNGVGKACGLLRLAAGESLYNPKPELFVFSRSENLRQNHFKTAVYA
ncbi:hypothetical protein OQA88_3833 [Cercophora sp. LCS_1]